MLGLGSAFTGVVMRRLATRSTVGAVVGAVVTAAGLTVTSSPAVMATPDDRRPQARADRLRVLEDRVLRLPAPGVLANDSGSGRLRAVLAAAPARARVEVRPNGAVRVVPATDVNGLLRFAYRAVDAEGRSDRAVGRVRVVPVNDAPVFVPGPDQVVGPDAGRQVVPGWATGIDAGAPNEQAQRLAFRIDDVSDPALFADDGLPTVSPKGLLSYTPAPGANGSATVTVTLTDDGGVASGGADRSTATQLRITISPRSVPPAVTAGPGTTSYFAGSAPVPLAPGLELVDDDSDIAGATVALVGGGVDGVRLAGPSGDGITASYDAASGILTLSGKADAATYQRALRTVTFATGPGASRGPRPVTIEVEDADGLTGRATRDVQVVRDDPSTTTADVATAAEDTTASGNVLANDIDPDDTLTVTGHTQPARGTLTIEPDGDFTYTPEPDWNGTVPTVTYTTGTGATGTLDITITPVNDAPVAAGDSRILDEDGAATIDVLANDTDADGDPLSAVPVTGPVHGTVVVDANGTLTYTPDANFHGTDSFTYQADDGDLTSGSATVTLTVEPVEDVPVAHDDSYRTPPDTAATGDVLANDVDGDGDGLFAVLVTGAMHGTVALHASGSFTYMPIAGYRGTDSFTYAASDGHASGNTATVTVVVDDPTITVADTSTVAEDTQASGNVLANDVDPDDTLTVTSHTDPGTGT
ncbi:Ig-like domain-containing protein, partial [Nocardioides caricicola]